jgi:hypothetical protein
MDSTPKAFNLGATQPRMDSTPKGLIPDWDSTPNGLNPNWDSILNGLNPDWDSTPTGTQPWQGLNLEFLSTSNGIISPSKYKNFTVFF